MLWTKRIYFGEHKSSSQWSSTVWDGVLYSYHYVTVSATWKHRKQTPRQTFPNKSHGPRTNTHKHTHTQLEFHLANTPPFDAYLCICHVPEQKFVKNICSANLSQHSLRRSLSPNKFVPMPSGNPEAPLFHIAIIIIILLQRNGSFHHSIERNFLVYKRPTYMAIYIL